MRFVWVVLVGLLALAPRARAQSCNRTDGAPCEPDMVQSDETVNYGSGRVLEAPAQPAAVPGELGSAWPFAGAMPLAGARNPHRVLRSDEAMQAWGASLLGIGYAGAAGVAIFALQSDGFYVGYRGADSSCHDQMAASLFVPAVGGLFAIGVQQNCSVVYGGRDGVRDFHDQPAWAVLGAVTAALQLTGLALLIVGSLTRHAAIDVELGAATLRLGPTSSALLGVDVHFQ